MKELGGQASAVSFRHRELWAKREAWMAQIESDMGLAFENIAKLNRKRKVALPAADMDMGIIIASEHGQRQV